MAGEIGTPPWDCSAATAAGVSTSASAMVGMATTGVARSVGAALTLASLAAHAHATDPLCTWWATIPTPMTYDETTMSSGAA